MRLGRLWLPAIITHGFNRADWSHIPGGVISGASLVKPDHMELKGIFLPVVPNRIRDSTCLRRTSS